MTVIIKKGKHESIVDSFCPPLRIASELLSLNFYPVNTPRLFLTYFKKKKTLIEFHFKRRKKATMQIKADPGAWRQAKVMKVEFRWSILRQIRIAPDNSACKA